MNDFEKTILGKVLNYGGRLLEGVALFGLFYNAFNPNQDSLRNAYIAASAGAVGVLLDKIGGKIASHVQEVQHIREREQIQKQLEQIVIENNIRMGIPADTKPEDRGRARAEYYEKVHRRQNA